jgi:hypothetical protein
MRLDHIASCIVNADHSGNGRNGER